MPVVRASAQRVPKIPHLPHLPQEAGQRRQGSGHAEGELVKEPIRMSLSDPISDMLTRIRNALVGRRDVVNVKASGICEGIARVLKAEGYIEDYKRIEDGKQGLLRIYLKYGTYGEDVIAEMQRISKPGCRVYAGVEDLPEPMGGLGIAVVSTSHGVLSGRECREKRVGGEVLCTVN
jgi:small subunit ribosomal protein S8